MLVGWYRRTKVSVHFSKATTLQTRETKPRLARIQGSDFCINARLESHGAEKICMIPPPDFCTRNAQPETRNSKPLTRNPKLETRNSKSQTPNPKPQTRNPKLETRKPEPVTRNPKPETRNPKSETVSNVGRLSGDFGTPIYQVQVRTWVQVQIFQPLYVVSHIMY